MDIFFMVVKRPWAFLIDLSRKFLSPSTEKRKVLMEKENKKATASEKLTKVVAIRISQTDYDIFLEKAKMENPESTKINISTINEQIQNIAQKKDTLCRRMYN